MKSNAKTLSNYAQRIACLRNQSKKWICHYFSWTFSAYDTIDGANCLTTKEKQTQKEAAIYAVKQIGLPQIKEINSSIFQGDNKIETMFFKRLELLKKYNSLFQKS